MLLGTDIRAITATLDALPIDVIGLNCSTGPTHMRDAVRYLVENSRCFVSVIPNAGLAAHGPQRRNDLSRVARRDGARARRLRRAISASTRSAAAAERRPRTSRRFAPRSARRARAAARRQPKPLQFAASAMTAVALKQDGSPLLIVGERINAQGSRKIKRLLARGRLRRIVLVAREQVEGGAHVLDVCTALTERTDEDVQMATLVQAARAIGRSAADDRLDRSRSDRGGAENLCRAARS